MDTNEVLSTYIRKLGHPLREIRERALQLLLAKLQLGWTLNDELPRNRQLLETLLAWFDVQQPTMQQEVLELLLMVIKTKGGCYAAREYNILKILEVLYKIKPKIHGNALDVYEDIVETLKFLNTVESQHNVNVPRLNIPSITSMSSENGGLFYDQLHNSGNKQSSEETYDSKEDVRNGNKLNISNGVNIFLFPWVDLSPSDFKTIVLIEDSLKLVKSTRRCCRFIRDVFICDFPAEIFLNRPAIVKALLAIADGQFGSSPGEALHVLLYITKALHKRLQQLFSADLICEYSKVPFDNHESYDDVNAELEQIVGRTATPLEDKLAALRQLPAPIYALDTAHTVLCIMIKSIVLIETDNKETLTLRELSICLCLIEALIKLLLDCVDEHFWTTDHTSKTQRDIAQKTCMTMRMLGDLLMKYHSSYQSDPDRVQHRVAWIRLLSCASELLNWAIHSPLPPTSLLTSLQNSLLDPGIDIFYPELNKRIFSILQNAKSAVDQEFKSRYRELRKLFASMDHAVEFMKAKNNHQMNKSILPCIKKSLPVLQIHTNESLLNDITNMVVMAEDLNFDDNDWSTARSVALSLMAHNLSWVQVFFYKKLSSMVKSVLMGEASDQCDNENRLTLLCDVSILTEICCHGLSSTQKEVEESASEIMLYLLRGRLVLSEGCWWRLLASLLPVLPLLHVYAAHDTQLGKAICKSLEEDIVECMGVSRAEMVWGLVRLLFVKCPAVQMYAAHSLCGVLDDNKYLPPKETLRTDILINALRRVEVQDFNIDHTSSPTKKTQTTGLVQLLEVLKQDLVLDEDSSEYIATNRGTSQPTLEPSLRRSTLQQLAVLMRQQDLHDAFIRHDGLKLIGALLRMSLTVEDYLAFPECAMSCVSVLNSVCFVARHALSKQTDLPLFLIRAILVFPSNESHVSMSSQVLALLAWAGFVLQEVAGARRRVPALPHSVAQRTSPPFDVNTYWVTSPNAEHTSVEWLLNDATWRTAIRVRWWWVLNGGKKIRGSQLLMQVQARGTTSPPSTHDLELLRSACVDYSCSKRLLDLENATTHTQVNEALCVLESYVRIMPLSAASPQQFGALRWQTVKRFLSAPPASPRDAQLLVALLQFIMAYMDSVPREETTMSWIKPLFIGNEATIISLLNRERLYPQQSPSEDIEVTQLRIHIVKILLRCILMLEGYDDYSSSKMESLLKILLSCLERVDLKNFHMLGYLNELLRCIRYGLHSRYCEVSEDTMINSLRTLSRVLTGCAAGAGSKGQACRLDAVLALMAILKKIRDTKVPVQRWGELCDGQLTEAVARCGAARRPELRAAALCVAAALAHYAQLTPQLQQYIPNESLCRYAVEIFLKNGEANAVRAAALVLLTTVTSRISAHNQTMESEVLQLFEEYNFVDECLQILVDFCNKSGTNDINYLEPNMPLTLLERRTELEVRSQKCQDVNVLPTYSFNKPPPTGDLVTTIADVFTNVAMFKNSPIQAWNERGLFRVMFRCACRSDRVPGGCVGGRVCRSLCVAVTHKCVRTLLAATKDCFHNLLLTLRPLDEGDTNEDILFARTQATLLLAGLLTDRGASDTLWWELKQNNSTSLFEMLLQFLESDDIDMQSAAMFCLTQLAQSIARKEKAKQSCIELLDNLKSPRECSSDELSAGDGFKTGDCQPEYIVEDLSKALMDLFKEYLESKTFLVRKDDNWSSLCSCLSSLLSVSYRSRLYAVHRQFPRVLTLTLQAFRDKLSLQGKQADVIRNANTEPVLSNLYWVLTLANSSMLDCAPCKESLAEDIATSLNKLWPWCMMTESLRDAILLLLLTMTNDCPKGWSCMCACVSGRSLAGEVCALAGREAGRARASPLLPLALRVLTHCAPHQHCRSLVLKSDVLSSACRLRTRGAAQAVGGAAGAGLRAAGAGLCEALSRHADGAAALLAALAPPALRPVPRALLTSLANAAHHQRLAFLQSPADLLEVLSGSLLTGDTAEVVSAGRAVWALAANNHRAKLVLRSAGITTAVQSTMQRLQRSNDVEAQRALELLTYTYNVLQAT